MLNRDLALTVRTIGWLVAIGVTFTGCEGVRSAEQPAKPAAEPVASAALQPGSDGAGGLAVASALETIFAAEAPPPEAGPVMTLSAARRESESTQNGSVRYLHPNPDPENEHAFTRIVTSFRCRGDVWHLPACRALRHPEDMPPGSVYGKGDVRLPELPNPKERCLRHDDTIRRQCAVGPARWNS